MSEQEQQTPQVEEVAKDVVDAQPETATADGKASAESTVESTEKPSTDEEPKATEPEAAAPAKDDSSSKEAETVSKDESDKEDKTKALHDEKKEETAENGKTDEEKPADAVAAKVGSKVDADAEKVESTEVSTDETNGVYKRKVENGAEPVAEDEKSPKKAKVVDETEQAKVEETAA